MMRSYQDMLAEVLHLACEHRNVLPPHLVDGLVAKAQHDSTLEMNYRLGKEPFIGAVEGFLRQAEGRVIARNTVRGHASRAVKIRLAMRGNHRHHFHA